MTDTPLTCPACEQVSVYALTLPLPVSLPCLARNTLCDRVFTQEEIQDAYQDQGSVA